MGSGWCAFANGISRQFLHGSDGKAHAMRGAAIAYEPAAVDRGLHRRRDNFVLEAKSLGNFMHTDPT